MKKEEKKKGERLWIDLTDETQAPVLMREKRIVGPVCR